MLGDYTGTSTGANRVDLCRVVALRGILGRAPAKIALARDALSPVFPYVTKGDGLYADGSFVQHTWVAYSGTYGYVLLDGLGRLFTLLGGSSWEVTDPARQIIFDSVERAYAPLLHNGLMMDSVNGRAVSRGYLRSDERHVLRSDHYHGHALIAAVALLAQGASAAERNRWHAMIKGWIARDRTLPVRTDRQYTVADLARLRQDRRQPHGRRPRTRRPPALPGHGPRRAPPPRLGRRPGHGLRPHHVLRERQRREPARLAHRRRHALLVGHRSGDDFGGDQYTDAFWPTVDPYRLPGTTVSTKRLADNEGGGWGEPKPAARWVGGTTDGEFAAIGQDLRGLASTLTARKSWFSLADCRRLPGRRHHRPRRRARRDRRRQPRPGRVRHRRRSPSTAYDSPARSGDHHLPTRPLGPPRRTRRLRLPRRRPPESAARGPHRLLARHQHRLLPAAASPAATSPSGTTTAPTPPTPATPTSSCRAPDRVPSPPAPPIGTG